MSELQKLESFRYSLAVAETFDEIKLIKDATTSFAELARLQNLSIEKQNEIGKFRVEITNKVGNWLDDNYPKGRENQYTKELSNNKELSKMPVSKRESSNSRAIARAAQEQKDAIMAEIESDGDIITPNKVANKLRDKKNDLHDLTKLTERQQREKEIINLSNDIKKKYNAGEIRLLIQFLNK